MSARLGAWISALERAWVKDATPAHRRTTYLAAAALLAVLCAVHGVTLGAVFPVDDAYISIHNAAGLVGSETSYVGVSPLVGATSGVHVMLMAALMLIMKPASAAFCVCWGSIALYVMGILRLAFGRGASVLQASLLALVGVTAGNVVYQLLNGLETGLALACVVWALAILEEPSRSARIARALLCGLMPFVRPELVLLGFMIVALEMRTTTRERAAFIGLALLAALPWIVLYARATGLPFPSTMGAKRVFFAEGCWPGGRKLVLVLERIMIWSREVGAIAWAWVLLVGLRRGWIGLLFATAMFAAYWFALPQVLDQYLYRYVYVLLPFGLFACAASFRAESSRRRIAAAALVIIGLVEALAGLDDHVDAYLRARRFTIEALEENAAWSREHLPRGARVLVHDAGYFSYATPFELVDVVGLKTPLREHTEITWASCGVRREEAIHRIALRLQPDHLVVRRHWPFDIDGALRRQGWRLEEIHHPPVDGYDVFRIEPPAR